MEEGQDVLTIVCGGGQHIGSGLIYLTWFRRLLVLCLYAGFAVFVVVVAFPASVFPFLRPLRNGASKNIQGIVRVRIRGKSNVNLEGNNRR